MKLRDFQIVIFLLFFAIANSDAKGTTDLLHESDMSGETSKGGGNTKMPPTVSPAVFIKDPALETAYYDVLNILSTSNPCSDFYGGSTATIEVFNQFVTKLRKERLMSSIAMRMSGETINLANAMTHGEYRMFGEVSINTNGPFYHRRISNAEPSVPRVGSFDPNTREVRVLILLHELGHLVKGLNGNWLLLDDGNNPSQSRINSFKIERICGEQIKGLGKSNNLMELAARRN